MKEVFSKSFWDGVKETFREALEDPSRNPIADDPNAPSLNAEHFKRVLQVKERELLAEIAQLKAEAQGSDEGEVRDATNAATSSLGASESLQEGSLASQTLIQVRNALERIEAGTYGKCVTCGKQIPLARLGAVPWAANCVEDQEKLDRAGHVQTGGSTL